LTRYALPITESKAASAEKVSLLLDNGSRLKLTSMTDLRPKINEMLHKFSDIDGFQGRTVIPFPHAPLTAFELIQKYDQLSIQDRFEQIAHEFGDDETRQLINAVLSINIQGEMAEGGLIDHLCGWALGNYDASGRSDIGNRYKLAEGMSALGQAMLNDCHNVKLMLSTPVISVNSENNSSVTITTSTGHAYTAKTAVITVPLNVLKTIQFCPPLSSEKQFAITQGQCNGGTKFWVKLEKPVGSWCGYAPYPNPITTIGTHDEEGSFLVGYGPDDKLNFRDIAVVQREVKKFLPDCQVEYVIGHDWRKDPFARGTWSWYRPGQISSSLRALQTPEPPLFFASADAANGWKGCIDGALERGLATMRDVMHYLGK
jgi:hypothetical protein